MEQKKISEGNAALKPPVEVRYQKELEALAALDTAPRPVNWKMSPKAVRTFILGSRQPLSWNGEEIIIRKKYLGNDALVERCIITLAGNRGLMLVGEPGTAKTMLSELLSAAISGNSTNTIQGTAGTTEDMIKYSWNYALLLAKGPVREALVPSPLYVGMEQGILTRFEEITRTPAEIQDSLISVLSDKVLNVPELGEEGLLFAKAGFNVIGTANTRDKGVNEMSSALKRRLCQCGMWLWRKRLLFMRWKLWQRKAKSPCQWRRMWQSFWLPLTMSYGKECLLWDIVLTVRQR